MTSALSMDISARIASLEFEAKEVRYALESLLTYSDMHGQDSFSQSEQTELLECIVFIRTYLSVEIDSILDQAIQEESHGDPIEEWAHDLQSEMDYLIKNAPDIS